MRKIPEYVGLCRTPRVYIRYINGQAKRVRGICGRRLTATIVDRNQCPACNRPFRRQPAYNKAQEEARRRRQMAARGLWPKA